MLAVTTACVMTSGLACAAAARPAVATVAPAHASFTVQSAALGEARPINVYVPPRHDIALDLSLWWNARALLDTADVRLAAVGAAPRTLFLANSDEPVIAAGTARLADIVRGASPSQLRQTYVPRPDLTHATIFRALKPAALVHAFR